MSDMAAVWKRIEAHVGEPFHQIRGAEFTYRIEKNSLIPSRTNRNIGRLQFEKALAHVPLEDTTPVQRLQGPSYLYAILMDPRIRAGEW
jgi:hypothetical protein